ncbi:cytochrome P450 [Coprinopsis marcescibilis]|uniref:Cytochrome P450 n=1 Tax=Coprinopsis marcescibilis TaxID=230819 RepID=A0A5C3KU25_COPMA|nr:cytochrome P450 [Coprinopsis marcescibilis]
MPSSFAWERFHEWCQEYDTDILYLNVAGTNMVILDTAEVAADLLEQRSSIYSGRPRMPMVVELMGWDFNISFMDYGDVWRSHRALVQKTLHPAASDEFRMHIENATINMLNRFLDRPDEMDRNLRQMAAEAIISFTYGLDVNGEDDFYVRIAEDGMAPMTQAASTRGSVLVDSFPILKHIPEWVPGASFQRKAREWKRKARRMVEVPYAAAKVRFETGESRPSFVSAALQRMKEDGEDEIHNEDVIKNAAGSMYSVSAVISCMLALVKNPDILRRAQLELDHVIEADRLPCLEDEASLPFISALVYEVLRWKVVTPQAVPHCASVDDEYRGYRIPAGTIVVGNAWAMLHDERVYPEPSKFNPDRFMKDGKLDCESQPKPDIACWGFGRRICPGRFMGYSAIWLAIACIISVFDVDKAKDENGDSIEPHEEYVSGLAIIAKPFKYQIKPRSKMKESMIRSLKD